jgi:hypothetical protein
MKQKRDAQGRFVKMYPTREEYEAKIAELETELGAKRILIGNLKNLIEVAGMSIMWLLKRVPAWTKKKFNAYHIELMNSYDDLKAVPDDLKKYV